MKLIYQFYKICFLLPIFIFGSACSQSTGPDFEITSQEYFASEMIGSADSILEHSLTDSERVSFIRNRPWLALNVQQTYQLENLLKQTNTIVSKGDLVRIVVASGQTAASHRDQQRLGINKIHSEKLVDLETEISLWKAQQVLLKQEINSVGNLKTEIERWDYLQNLIDDKEAGIKNRGRRSRLITGAPFRPFYFFWRSYHVLSEKHAPEKIDFKKVRIYEPQKSDSEDELLNLYAPRIIQEINVAADYDTRIDMLGKVRLILKGDCQPDVLVDTSEPEIYGYTSQARIGDETLQQLNYTIWYPQHAAHRKMDPEAGPTEGIMLRVTLTKEHTPLIYESVLACGCYHKIFPTEELEHEAREQFGSPLKARSSSLARKIKWKIDPVIPETAGKFDNNYTHPLVWVHAGSHVIAKVENGRSLKTKASSAEIRVSKLTDYNALETLPFGDRRASMFDKNGLVWNSDRLEAKMLYPSGIFHAGTPRLRGTHMIHFDHYDFDDPELLSKILKLPDELPKGFQDHRSATIDMEKKKSQNISRNEIKNQLEGSHEK